MEIVSNKPRTPIILVTGLDPTAVGRTADSLIVAGTTLVHHELATVGRGAVTRTLRSVDLDGREQQRITTVELEHGCVSCTMRNDLLPLLRRLHRRGNVETIVLVLDPSLEPEEVCWAIEHVVVGDMPGFVDGPAGLDVVVHATITCLAENDWLDAVSGDTTLGEAGYADLDDDRTVAQVAVNQVAFADALIVTGTEAEVRDTWESARLMAVLARLAPGAPVVMELPDRPVTPLIAARLLAAIPGGSRRGRIDGPHVSLLARRPPLEPECGVTVVEFSSDRPFHPERLHEALDILLDGVVCSRGRLWLATRPDQMYWLESAGGALQIAESDRWLAALDPDERARIDPERRAMAALRWDDDHGDRHTSLVVLSHRADPIGIQDALRRACLDDTEMAEGPALWMAYADPFGPEHQDPCADSPLHTADGLSSAEHTDGES